MAHNLLNEIEIGSKNGLLKKRIITHYMHNGSSTIPDLARELNLSVPTVTKFINEMCDDGYINDYGKLETVSGRHPSLYGLNPESGYFIGVDIKKFTLNIGLMNFKGDMVDLKMNIPYKFKNTAEGLEELCVLVREFIRETGIETGKIRVGLQLQYLQLLRAAAGGSLAREDRMQRMHRQRHTRHDLRRAGAGLREGGEGHPLCQHQLGAGHRHHHRREDIHRQVGLLGRVRPRQRDTVPLRQEGVSGDGGFRFGPAPHPAGTDSAGRKFHPLRTGGGGRKPDHDGRNYRGGGEGGPALHRDCGRDRAEAGPSDSWAHQHLQPGTGHHRGNALTDGRLHHPAHPHRREEILAEPCEPRCRHHPVRLEGQGGRGGRLHAGTEQGVRIMKLHPF